MELRRADVLLTWLFGLFLRCLVSRAEATEIRRVECWLTIFLVLLAIVLAAAYYAYCVYGKSTRSTNKETEPLMPVATATPVT